jgi:hypothetical protein
MIMKRTNRPYRAPEVEAGRRWRELPDTDPLRDAEERSPTFWLPIAIAIALFIGLGYFFYGHAWKTNPTMGADSGAITKSEPSPN